MEHTLDKLIKERDEYLENHPELKPYQKVIDEILDKTPKASRLDVVTMIMLGKLEDLKSNLDKLKSLLSELN